VKGEFMKLVLGGVITPTIMATSIDNMCVSSMMIVDDDPSMRSSMSVICGKILNCSRIYVASNGLEALSIFRKNPDIDLILTDVCMPKMDGMELVSEVRKMNSSVPIVIMTAAEYLFNYELGDLEIADPRLKRLLKPYGVNVLLECVRELMEDKDD
jgi:YesN/AraC family two-component response regulator